MKKRKKKKKATPAPWRLRVEVPKTCDEEVCEHGVTHIPRKRGKRREMGTVTG